MQANTLCAADPHHSFKSDWSGEIVDQVLRNSLLHCGVIAMVTGIVVNLPRRDLGDTRNAGVIDVLLCKKEQIHCNLLSTAIQGE